MHTVDLHIHSWYSEDGTWMPARLVQMAAAQGIRQMAIADHNTVRGVGEAMEEAQRQGTQCVPAIEADCTLEGVDLHVLGYHIDWQSPDFAWLEQNIHQQTAEASLKKLERVNQQGFSVTAEEMTALAKYRYHSDCWTGEMFAQALLRKPALADHPLLLPYRPGGARGENPLVAFYWDWFAQGKPCHVPLRFPGADETIRMIHQSGGQAVIAHPGVNLKNCPELLERLNWLGLDGIEVQSSYHTREQALFYAQKAREYHLTATCGSDFHGETKPSISLGGYPDLAE